MKKAFSIIIIICMIATFGYVSFDFFREIAPANKITASVYTYTKDNNNNILINDLNHCSTLTNSVISTNLNSEQKSYLDELSLTIKNLNTYMLDLSNNLINETKKSSRISRILDSIDNLENLRNELLFELSVYSVKMSGNTIGDPVTTYSLLLEDVFEFVKETNHTFSLIHEYVSIKGLVSDITKLNIYEIYLNSLNNLADNYDKANIAFNNQSFTTLKILNNKITLENNNIKTNQEVIGGTYSHTASLFNKNYESVDKLEFIRNFHLKSFQDIDIKTEQQLDNITYYYLILLLGVN